MLRHGILTEWATNTPSRSTEPLNINNLSLAAMGQSLTQLFQIQSN
jgi:hypothetical protein